MHSSKMNDEQWMDEQASEIGNFLCTKISFLRLNSENSNVNSRDFYTFSEEIHFRVISKCFRAIFFSHR